MPYWDLQSEKGRTLLLRWIIIAALLVRIPAIFIAASAILTEDAFEYGKIANNIISGMGYSFNLHGLTANAPTAWMSPFYPYLLAGYSALFGPKLIGIAILQVLIGVFMVPLLYAIGKRIAGANIGLISAGLWAFYPEAIFMPSKFVAEPWLLLWQVLFILSGLNYLRSGNIRFILFAGILGGLIGLTKETAVLYPVCLIIWLYFKIPHTKKFIYHSVLLLIITFLAILPWSIRNTLVFDKFILLHTDFWMNVWSGNHPGATGTMRFNKTTYIDDALDPDYAQKFRCELVGTEQQIEAVYKKYALEFIRENPRLYIKLCLKRLLYFWTIDPTHPLSNHPLYWIPWFFLFLFAGVGLFSVRHRWRDYIFFYLLIIASTAIYSLIIILPRYRIPLLPGLMLLAAEGSVWIFEQIRRPKKRSLS